MSKAKEFIFDIKALGKKLATKETKLNEFINEIQQCEKRSKYQTE